MTESALHKELKFKAKKYLWNKGLRIVGNEVYGGYYGVYDVYGISPYSYCAIGIEVKISRSDWRNNKHKETKSEDEKFYLGAEENYILCPAELIQPEEIHPRWGLLWYKNGKLRNKKKPYHCKVLMRNKLCVIIGFLESNFRIKNK